MAKIFISYRREDTAEICGRIFDRLESHYGDHSVLKDVDSIPAGADFRAYLAHMVTQCDVMMVVIGPRWFGLDPYHPRLHDPNDFVRSEVELALRRGIPIIPVLVYGIDMPAATSLPPSLAPLSFRHALWVRGDPDFRRDLDRVIAGIDGMIAAKVAAAPGDATPVDLSPQVRDHLNAVTASGSATTGAPNTAQQAGIAPPAGAGVTAPPTATPATTGPHPPFAPIVPPASLSQPLPPPTVNPASSYPPQPGFGAFAPATGAPGARPAGIPTLPSQASSASSGPYIAPPRPALQTVPLGGQTWGGARPQGPAPRRRASSLVVVLSIVCAVVVIAGAGAGLVYLTRHAGGGSTGTGSATRTPSSERVLYQNTLTTPDSGWQQDANCFFHTDGYHIVGFHLCFAPISDQQNVDITVDMDTLSGDLGSPHGIFFRHNGNPDRYEFDVDPYGHWTFYKCLAAQNKCASLVDFTPNSAIHGGLHTVNTLEVIAVGSHFTFRVNGTQVGSADDSQLTVGTVGLAGNDNSEVVFSNLKITLPQ